jgi:hypothetical protein
MPAIQLPLSELPNPSHRQHLLLAMPAGRDGAITAAAFIRLATITASLYANSISPDD